MDPEMTLEQKENLKTWAEQRDSILSEISVLKTESEKLQKINKDLANSITDVESRMNEIRGRIEELKIKENELPLVISKEVVFLQSKKSTLEAEINSLLKIVEILTSQKTSLEADVSFALNAFDAVKGETFLLDKIVDKVTTVSQDNTNKINTLVNDLAASLEEIIAVNRKNVFETNIVIEKVPAMIMEAQKHGLIKNKI
jgi:predicted  nucleic acid-binding Zn-ribbon protein